MSVAFYIENLPDHKRGIALELRSIILNSIPGVEEQYKYKCPFYVYRGLLCYLSPTKNGMYIGFIKGTSLQDEDQRLTGEHLKQIRHLNFNSISDIDEDVVKDFLFQAVEVNSREKSKKNKEKRVLKY